MPDSITSTTNPPRGKLRAVVTQVTPASATDQVLTVVGGPSGCRRSPCPGCPWRIDQTGSFSAASFRVSANTAYDASFELFGCHESGPGKPATCAGFLLRNSLHNIGARLEGIAGGADCRSEIALHPSYRAMAIANGVAPDCVPLGDLMRGTATPHEARRALHHAIVYLHRSMDAERSMMRTEWLWRAAGELRRAANLNTPRRDALLGHAALAETLAVEFYGDGCAVQRLFDELCSIADGMRAQAASAGCERAAA